MENNSPILIAIIENTTKIIKLFDFIIIKINNKKFLIAFYF